MAAATRRVDGAHAAAPGHPMWVAEAAVWVAAVADIARHRAESATAVGVAGVVAAVLSAPAQDAHAAAAVAVAPPEPRAAAHAVGRRDPEAAARRAAKAENHSLSLPRLLGSDTLASP